MAERPKLGELLVTAGVVDAAALDAALAKQRAQGGRIGRLLVEAGVLSEETLVRTLARQLSIPVAWLRDKQVKPEVLARLPGHVARRHRCLPVLIDSRGTETLLVAMEDPSDAVALDEVAAAAACPVRVVLAAPSELDDALLRHYPDDEEPELLLEEPLLPKPRPPDEAQSAKQAPPPAEAQSAELARPPAGSDDAAFDLAAPGDASLDLGSDLDMDAPRSGGVDLDSDDALDLDADTAAGGRPADSLDAAIDDARGAAGRSGASHALDLDTGTDELEADTGTDLDTGSDELEADTGTDLDVGPDLDADADTGTDLAAGDELEIGPNLDAREDSQRAASGARVSSAAPGSAALPRDPELRAVVRLLIERGLLDAEEIAQCLRAAREPSGSGS
jgi:hypothetical protein